MNIKIKIFSDPSIFGYYYNLGWIEIIENEKIVCFFNQTLCMVFLTIQSLVEFLVNPRRISTNWIGEDSGKIYVIQKKKGELIFSKKNTKFKYNENEFKIALLKECQETLTKAKTNPLFNREDFKDFIACMKVLDKSIGN